MARENVELVLRGIEALSRRDVDGALAPFHEDIVLTDAGTGVGTTGRAAFSSYLKDFLRSWASYHETVELCLDLEDRVVLCVRTEACGEGSGVPLTSRHGEIHEFDEGLVRRLTIYQAFEDACAAAGADPASAQPPPETALAADRAGEQSQP